MGSVLGLRLSRRVPPAVEMKDHRGRREVQPHPATPPSLPADVAALRALVLATMAERDVLVEERDALATQNDRLRHLLVKLQRLQFGWKSERLPEEQLHLGLEDLETAIAQGEAKAEQRDPDLRRERTAKRRANRGALPAHLPRIEVVLEPRDPACPCCQKTMVMIGEDRSERLDVNPAQVRVLVTRRPKLACRACAGVVVRKPRRRRG
jgi:transposase